jgi:hypothetical protein
MDQSVIVGIIENSTGIILLTSTRFIRDGSCLFAKSIHERQILAYPPAFIANDLAVKSIRLDREPQRPKA